VSVDVVARRHYGEEFQRIANAAAAVVPAAIELGLLRSQLSYRRQTITDSSVHS